MNAGRLIDDRDDLSICDRSCAPLRASGMLVLYLVNCLFRVLSVSRSGPLFLASTMVFDIEPVLTILPIFS